eukprot:TRINITY_DN6317_c0_g1_i2.p1 TRINITY_DN6317_c0_g1~~TRINITY_DN6317_c0_g1_i2.p1  ORF type:complete len:329 (+),score=44.20 TRINITY_DN6317_c0_g1_i2:60-1046(+)
MKREGRLLFLLVVIGIIGGCASIKFAANHPFWYFSEWNWHVDSNGIAQATNSGSYFKLSFTGSTSVQISLDQSGSYPQPFMTVSWSINDGPEQFSTLTSSVQSLTLATQLSQNSIYNITFWIINSLQSIDRWDSPLNFIRIRSVQFSGPTARLLPATTRPGRLMIYWDSIGEGVNVEGCLGDLRTNNGRETWAFALAEAINSEISMIGWGGQGYTVGGGGNVPQLWSASGSPQTSAWNHYNAKLVRNFTQIGCPDYVLCGHGTNDGLQHRDQNLVYTQAYGWFNAMRSACPNSWIFLVVPFGLFEEEPIVKVYNTVAKNGMTELRSCL